MLLVGLVVPSARGVASEQTHEFDEAWIGRIHPLRYKRQLRLVERSDVFAPLNANVVHRIATVFPLRHDNREHHRHYDRQQQ
jgi:hypothetical protein